MQAVTRLSDTYGAAAQDILKVLDAASVTSATIAGEAPALDALLAEMIGLSRSGIALLGANKDRLVTAVNLLDPTTSLLTKYHGALTCMLVGAKIALDTGYLDATGGANGYSLIIDSTPLFGADQYRFPQNLPIVGAKGGPGGKPGCGSLPDVAANWPLRQLITNTGWGTGLDIRPNPGIAFPGYADYLPVTRGQPEPPSVRYPGGPAPAPSRTRVRRPTALRSTHRTAPRCTRACRRRRRPAPHANQGPRHRDPSRSSSRRRHSCSRHRPRRSLEKRHRRRDAEGEANAMRDNLGGAIWRLAIFMVVCTLGLIAMLAIFADLRFGDEKPYRAHFSNVSGLESGNFVRIAGVEVGQVKRISIRDDGTAMVEFGTDNSVVLTEGTKAVIRYQNLIGGRYLALEEGSGGSRQLRPGDTIPLAQTSPALDLDALIGGFRPLFHALDPDQINALSTELIKAFQGEGATISSFLARTAALTNTLADRGQLIGQVIVNLNTVLGSLGDQSSQFAKAVDSMSQLLSTLADNKQEISTGIAYANAAAGSIADLLAQGRAPLADIIHQSERIADVILADRDYFDDLLNTLPDAYQMLNRQGLYGDFFSFYMCDLLLKLNGKGGQPIYVKMIGQPSGRCTPR